MHQIKLETRCTVSYDILSRYLKQWGFFSSLFTNEGSVLTHLGYCGIAAGCGCCRAAPASHTRAESSPNSAGWNDTMQYRDRDRGGFQPARWQKQAQLKRLTFLCIHSVTAGHRLWLQGHVNLWPLELLSTQWGFWDMWCLGLRPNMPAKCPNKRSIIPSPLRNLDRLT